MRQLLDLLLVAVEGVAGRFGDRHGAPLGLPQETQTEQLFDLVGKFLPRKKCLPIAGKLCQQILFCLRTAHHQIPHRIAQQLARRKEPLICLIAKSPADLIREGKILDHCVGRMNYDQRFIREESLIFFIRTKEQPNTPFVTLEFSLKTHKVLQCYGEHDHKPNDNVLHYVNKVWLPYANKHLKQIQNAA